MSDFVDFEYFKELARRESDPNAKSGFGPEHRAGKTEAILMDLIKKLPALTARGSKLIDIGSGCSDLTRGLISQCLNSAVETVLVDSVEVLEQLGDLPTGISTAPHRFPNSAEFLSDHAASADAVLMYSVIQSIGVDQDPLELLLEAARLLKPGGGRLLVGDIPNASKKARFLASEFGRAFDREWRSTTTAAKSQPRRWTHEYDDAAILAMLKAMRDAGYECFVLPQPGGLAMNWTREDLLVIRV